MKKDFPKIRIRRIPLEPYIDVLMDLWEQGFLFIDLVATNDITQDTLTVMVREEYLEEENILTEEYDKEFPPPSSLPKEIKLTEKLLNSLI